uniref:Pseudouridine synthase II N-terminal domain-containing protein n=1 Tax=Panagrolaimus sp. PS1159 TaxID=55785 RepID=A0AC35GKX7_9BILA
MKVSLTSKDIWQLLNGVLCVYKPRDISLFSIKKRIVSQIVEEGNTYDDGLDKIPLIDMPIVEPHAETEALVVVGTHRQLDYRKHPLMVGKAFRAEDIMIEEINDLEPASSGICAFAIGSECYKLDELRHQAWINTYRMVGKFGEQTDKHMIRGRIIERAEWEHISRHKLQKLLTRLRAQYKRTSFELAEVDIKSQAAFELARKGVPRPRILDSPIVYNATVNNFHTPYFDLTIQVTGETDYFLRAFIHELGLSLGTVACTKQLRRIRMDILGKDHALLDKELNLTNIIRNILLCNKSLELAKEEKKDPVIKVKKMNEMESNAIVESYKPVTADEMEEEDCLRIPWGREYKIV